MQKEPDKNTQNAISKTPKKPRSAIDMERM
jgi:hypothetical protein